MNGPEQLKSILVAFWCMFGDRRKHGVGFSNQRKLEALVFHSNLLISYHKQQSLGDRRTKFDKAKQKLHPWRRFGKCFVCAEPATARHHIIQLQNGGNNGKKNLVSLCDTCHAEIHPWLK